MSLVYLVLFANTANSKDTVTEIDTDTVTTGTAPVTATGIHDAHPAQRVVDDFVFLSCFDVFHANAIIPMQRPRPPPVWSPKLEVNK